MTTGYERQAYADLTRIADALERIADALESPPESEPRCDECGDTGASNLSHAADCSRRVDPFGTCGEQAPTLWPEGEVPVTCQRIAGHSGAHLGRDGMSWEPR